MNSTSSIVKKLSRYQKDWARYVYSAKKIETQENRLLQMAEALADGYKSIDLFRRKIK